MATPAEAVVFDKAEFEGLFYGDAETARMVVGKFLEMATAAIEAIEGGVDAADAEGLNFALHRLKGAAANVRANRLAEVAASLESEALNGNVEAVRGGLADLKDEFGEFERHAVRYRTEGA